MDKRTKKRMIRGYIEAGGYAGWSTQTTAMQVAEQLYLWGCRAYAAGRIAAEKMQDKKEWKTIVELTHGCNRRYLISRGAAAENIEDIINILNNGGTREHLAAHLKKRLEIYNPRREQVK